MQKSLFATETLQDAPDPVAPKSRSTRSKSKTRQALCRASDAIAAVIGNLSQDECIHYVSMCEWSTHDLTIDVLNQIGPAHMYFCTWSVSENAIRQLLAAMQDGRIASVKGVFDWRVRVRRPEAYELAKHNIADIRLTTCHAKIVVLQNQQWSVAIVGSANFTNNPRIEAGIISTERAVGDFHRDWMLAEIANAKPFGETNEPIGKPTRRD